jgi:hypothetical protein
MTKPGDVSVGGQANNDLRYIAVDKQIHSGAVLHSHNQTVQFRHLSPLDRCLNWLAHSHRQLTPGTFFRQLQPLR